MRPSGERTIPAMESRPTALEEIYPLDWMRRVKEREHPSAVWMADTVFRHLQPGSVLDLGCGPANHANILAAAGCRVTAVDGVCHAQQFVHPAVKFIQADLCEPLDLNACFDTVLCLEVAEHLPESAEDTLCANMVRHVDRWLVFTAAPPGQEGRHHINLKPLEYWIGKLERLGLTPRRRLAAGWRKDWHGKGVKRYYVDNLMVFEARG